MKHDKDTQTLDIEEAIAQQPTAFQTIGYVRVSSDDQNTVRQLANVKLDKIFTDKITGIKTKRPALDELLAYVRHGDVVVIHSLDRLARDLSVLIDLVGKFKAKGVTVKFIKENLAFNPLSNNPMDDLLFHVFGAIAQFQRAIIKETQREGIEIAKKKGKYKGRPPALDKEKVAELKAILIQKNSDLDNFKKLSYTQIAKDFGISTPALWRYRNEIEKELKEKKPTK
jgi:DNA invertase Pin-like site-specific DNA recombinase